MLLLRITLHTKKFENITSKFPHGRITRNIFLDHKNENAKCKTFV